MATVKKGTLTGPPEGWKLVLPGFGGHLGHLI